jgi:type II secretory ATPase GspE/PulE/Tfp pilus assembly ATPase PilB-like protein
LKLLGLKREDANSHGWRKGKGCSHCFQSGYSDREAVIELLNIDERVREIIYEGTVTQLRRYLHEIQYDSFLLAAIAKITQGLTTVEEVRRVLPHSAFARPSAKVISSHANALRMV